MMLSRSPRFTFTPLVAAILALSVCAWANQTVLYQTGFEASNDVSGTNFSTGDLNGQGGWQVSQGAASVTDAKAQAGAQSVAMDAGSAIEKLISGGGEIWVIGYYSGDGATGEPNYDGSVPAAAIVHFSATNGIQCYNGDGSGHGTWLPPTGGKTVSSSTWTQIALHIVYNAADPTKSYWDCLVDGQKYQTGLGFRDNSVTALNGFKSLSSAASGFDSFKVISSNGDTDGDGVPDWYELTQDKNPLDPASFPIVADVNGDGNATPLDGLIQYRVAMGLIPLPAGATLLDVNGDGVTNNLDGILIYHWTIGDPRVPFLPVR